MLVFGQIKCQRPDESIFCQIIKPNTNVSCKYTIQLRTIIQLDKGITQCTDSGQVKLIRWWIIRKAFNNKWRVNYALILQKINHHM